MTNLFIGCHKTQLYKCDENKNVLEIKRIIIIFFTALPPLDQGNDWLQNRLQVLGQINPLPNQLRLNNLKVPGTGPAGNLKWSLWSGIMTFRLVGLENTNVAS